MSTYIVIFDSFTGKHSIREYTERIRDGGYICSSQSNWIPAILCTDCDLSLLYSYSANFKWIIQTPFMTL